jgi:hypothetical protein
MLKAIENHFNIMAYIAVLACLAVSQKAAGWNRETL